MSYEYDRYLTEHIRNVKNTMPMTDISTAEVVRMLSLKISIWHGCITYILILIIGSIGYL